MPQKIVIITPKDIQRVLGRGYKASTRLHRRIRLHFGKSDYQFISIEEFCAFTGLTLEKIESVLTR